MKKRVTGEDSKMARYRQYVDLFKSPYVPLNDNKEIGHLQFPRSQLF